MCDTLPLLPWHLRVTALTSNPLLHSRIARVTLKYARSRLWIDHESFLAYGIGLTFLTLGVVGMLGGDDLLCCFIVGNAFTWDDSYRLETEDDTFQVSTHRIHLEVLLKVSSDSCSPPVAKQDVIDSLLNVAIFTFMGASIPWGELNNSEYGRASTVAPAAHSQLNRGRLLMISSTLRDLSEEPWRLCVFPLLVQPYHCD